MIKFYEILNKTGWAIKELSQWLYQAHSTLYDVGDKIQSWAFDRLIKNTEEKEQDNE